MSDTLPLLLRAARGESVERPPVWMMRQAGRYMKDLKTPISRTRSPCSPLRPSSLMG